MKYNKFNLLTAGWDHKVKIHRVLHGRFHPMGYWVFSFDAPPCQTLFTCSACGNVSILRVYCNIGSCCMLPTSASGWTSYKNLNTSSKKFIQLTLTHTRIQSPTFTHQYTRSFSHTPILSLPLSLSHTHTHRKRDREGGEGE